MSEAAERIRTAIQGKPPHAFARVYAADVIAVGREVGRPDNPLVTGAANAARCVVDPAGVEVYQVAGQLAELLGDGG